MDRWHLDLIVRQSRFSCRMCRWRGLASKGPHRFLVALTPARPRYDAGTGTTPLPALDLRGSPAADDPDGAQTITGTAFGMLPILPDSNSSGIKPGPIHNLTARSEPRTATRFNHPAPVRTASGSRSNGSRCGTSAYRSSR
ncbi:hypothetical protein ACFOLD_15015 [Kocuria carniphila]|uniref:hypothetical protein n=1 Tax=Kocuria carniphila TaxID=262208 RepID=UPI00361F26AB